MKRHTPTAWAAFFGISIVDIDGWKGKEDYSLPITIAEFLPKVAESTVQVEDWARYQSLLFML